MTTKKIKTSDILGDNYYIYELTSSNYTPALNDTITITCTMKDVYGAAASGKSITLYQNGTSKGAQTTNSSGVATWSITCSTAGLQKFNIKDTSIEVLVDDSLHNITLRFEDDCSDDTRLSNYGDSIPFNGESSNEWETFHRNNFHAYILSGSGGYFSGREILPLHGINDGKVRIKFYLFNDSAFNQLCIFCTDQTPSSTEATYPYGTRVRGDSLFQYFTLTNEETIHDETALNQQWLYLEAIKNGRTWIINLYDDTLNLIASETKTNLATMTNPNWYLVIQTETSENMVGINEIIVDSITDGIVPYSGVQKSSDNGMKTISPRNGKIDLNDYTANGNYIYMPSHDTSGIDTYHFPSDITVDNAFTLIVENYPYSESDSVVHQTLYPLSYAYTTDPATVYIRYTYDDWTKVGEVDIDLPSIITLSTSKQKLNENESFKIYANVKDNDGHAINNETLTLMCQYESYSNSDMWATGYVRDEGFYVNDTIFKGDWSCRFEVNSTRDHTGLQLYTSSEQRILFSTLGAYITSNIKITCTNNIITINVDGTDYGTTYTQNSNGTKVGFFTHEDYTVSIKNFVVNNAMLYKDCGSQTTDSNGNCSWSFNDGLSQGLYHFYVNNTNLDIFVDALIDHEKYKTFPTTVTQTIFNTYNGTWLTPINVPNDAIIKFTLTTNSISSMVGEYLIYMGEIDSLTSTAFYIGIINSKFTIGLGCSGDEYYPPIPDNLSNGAEIGFKIDEIEITDDFGENTGYHEYDISFTYFIDDAEYHHTFSTEIPNEYLPIDWNRIIAAQTGGVVITKLRLERPLMSDGIYDNSPQLVTSNTIFDELSNNWFKKNENIVHEIESNTDEWFNFNGDWVVEGSTITFIAGENGHIKFGGTLGVSNEIEINIENYTDITITDNLSGDEWGWHPNDAGTRNVFTITLPTYTLTTINGSPGYTWNINLTCNSDSQSYSTVYTNTIDDSAVFNNNEKATMLERNHLSEVQGDIKRIEYTKSYKSYHPENNNFNLITSDGVYHAIDAFFDTIYPIDSTYITTNPGTDPNDILRGEWTVEDTFTADSNEYAIWRRVG